MMNECREDDEYSIDIIIIIFNEIIDIRFRPNLISCSILITGERWIHTFTRCSLSVLYRI
jgi:hypothetical protein